MLIAFFKSQTCYHDGV